MAWADHNPFAAVLWGKKRVEEGEIRNISGDVKVICSDACNHQDSLGDFMWSKLSHNE